MFRDYIPNNFEGYYGCLHQHILGSLQDADVQRLAGNGMSFQVMGVAIQTISPISPDALVGSNMF